MRIASLAAAGIVLSLLSPGAAAQQPRSATVEGTVFARDTGAPIERAHVELPPVEESPRPIAGLPPPLLAGGAAGGTPAVGATSRTATTATDGTFAIRNVPPGEYRLYATRPTGYVPGEYGQRTATGTGVPFTLESGERKTVSMVMTPTGTISGHVRDALGDASGYAHVQALRAIYRDGHRSLTVMQLVQADDRGMYRLFWLPPGEYFVCAKPLDLRRSSEMMHIPPPSRFGAYEQQMRPTVTAINTSELQEDGTVAEGQYRRSAFRAPRTSGMRRPSGWMPGNT